MIELLSIEKVTVRFDGLVALRDVSLAVEDGTVLGVIGPNGAGKTTLFNVVSGLVRPQSGTIRWCGEELRDHRPDSLASLGISRTLQSLGLFQGMSVLDNVLVGAGPLARSGPLSTLLGLRRAARDEAELRDRAMETLTGLGIADVHAALPGSLPYGIRKRVALARALVAEPRLLLLDEPASGLAADEIDELEERITALATDCAVVVVEHNIDWVMRVCSRVVVLDFGEVIAAGRPAYVQNDQRVIDAYLGVPA
ncbi:ABC transporter ATP-binding protein [Kibdelosporangium aridum]|uniref:ABC transporter ATP-binding protein n=1 Tax=Kibdelosporangium aridum TaxID=2030 RepID=A0A428Z3K6_KIBAR|nr:ABC transporter ATP-binding protein [Kibdelosporangium aridum]RSM80682.1 ABC transporter ATP-binding protein [Kibdelosporangium aridum]